MGDDVVLVEVDDGVATITLHRPEARNALNRAMRRRLPEVVTELEVDDSVDVLILTGADPAFCAGVDLKEFGSGEVAAFCRQLAADSRTIDQAAVRRMLATYAEGSATTVEEAWNIEDRVSREWEGAGFDPAAIEAKRAAIVERGREQTR